jgi:UDP-N-acetylmuramoyl-tripeptide--D-alanyl-D-alanine ligase
MKAAFRRLVASLFERQVRRVIKRHGLKVVAVAGSVGKTSTKMAIFEVLRTKYRTLTGLKNYNSEIGLPLSVFGFEVPKILFNPFAWLWLLLRSELKIASYPYEVLVLELGTDHPGEIPRYLRYLNPDIGVITAVTPEHMEYFPGGLDDVAKEELALAQHSKVAVINADDTPAKYIKQYLGSHKHVIQYGRDSATELPATPHIIGHMRLALLAAEAVGRQLKVPDKDIARAAKDFRPVPGRMNVLPGINGSVIIDDTYNSSPEAVVAALKSLEEYPGKRKIALLGSMNELGEQSPHYHRQVGPAAAGVDLLVTLGEQSNQYLGPAAVKAGLDPSLVKPADSPYAAAEFLKVYLKPGDVLLAKGSQNRVFAEEAVKHLLADQSDVTKLVRQSVEWVKAKRDQFPDYRP